MHIPTTRHIPYLNTHRILSSSDDSDLPALFICPAQLQFLVIMHYAKPRDAHAYVVTAAPRPTKCPTAAK